MSSEYDFMCVSWKCLPKAPTVEEALNTQGDGAGGGGPVLWILSASFPSHPMFAQFIHKQNKQGGM